MRLSRVWTVAGKELREFRSNKYVLFTLVFMPLLLAFLLPLSTFGPIASLGPTDEPLPLDPAVNETIEGEVLRDVVLRNVSLRNSVVEGGVIHGSVVVNSTLVGVLVNGSVLEGVVLRDALVRGSNLIDLRDETGSSIQGSALLGEPGEDFFNLITTLVNSYLLLFIVLPAAIPAVLASYSLVGEKVSRSLEPLLATPTTDGEILAGKSLSIFLPTMGATWLASTVFMILTNRIVAPLLGGNAPLPNPSWVLAIGLLAPLFCVLSIAANVLVSSRVSDVRASQQLGTLVVLPALLLFFAVILGALSFRVGELLLFSLLILAADAVVGFLALQTFRREEILVSWK